MVRSRRAIILGIALLLPMQLGAAVSGEVSLSSIVSEGAESRLNRGGLADGPAGVLASAAGLERFPTACATPILLHLATPAGPGSPLPEALRRAQRSVSVRPRFVDGRTERTSDGSFVIHFSAGGRALGFPAVDRDRDGIPDLVNRVAESLVASRSFLVGSLGYADPSPEGQPLHVFMHNLGRGLAGYLVPAQRAGRTGIVSSSQFIVLDTALSSDRILETVFHQVAHAALETLAPGSEPWWSEATASFLTLTATGDPSGQWAALRARLETPGHGLASDVLTVMQGSLLWPLFLTERTGDAAIVRRIWSEAAEQGLDPLAAADLVLARDAGLSLAQAFREQTVWNLFTGERDAARHYAMGHALPEAPLPQIGPGLPFYLGPVEPVDPLGSVAFRLPSEHRKGALALEVRADGGRPAADLLVFYSDAADQPVLVPLPLDEGGRGRVSIPWTQAAGMWIVLRNDALPQGEPARFEVSGALDPSAPYDLASLTSREIGTSILLEWTTASEQDLIGWNIHRSESPSGPFIRLNHVALPAFGDGSIETGYIFMDEGGRDGARYYYFLEGLTRHGLAERSHLTSVRTSRRR